MIGRAFLAGLMILPMAGFAQAEDKTCINVEMTKFKGYRLATIHEPEAPDGKRWRDQTEILFETDSKVAPTARIIFINAGGSRAPSNCDHGSKEMSVAYTADQMPMFLSMWDDVTSSRGLLVMQCTAHQSSDDTGRLHEGFCTTVQK
ncbi:hypothetical protein [Hoeflea prorocentri]|uniref:Uncharacterized protein n=1 Tax=Hoeflea prorocentri TaxID=1922333 RepID=A0A9X3UMV5_9HYPH|nr:hypothetical protein [Hoeflea prorocentri]MCY6382114.1 hypothetical protein [Hoeflea prorocentri]MDA5399914.1 hypothetical protein [Hoeflea prorocentri]